tara:strand:+ start:750 stop:1889 length:1140 start_codon:yes stop_codon:yes gene_type:complete
MINVFQPNLGEEELNAIKDVFNSNWIGKGNKVDEFETSFSNMLRESRSSFFSTTCCTEGLFLFPELFKFKPDDEIIVPNISFVAVASSIIKSGAKLILCDVDKNSLNTTADLVEKKITKNTRALILNHYGGVPCDMDPIKELCKIHNIILIEDSACAVKSFYKGKATGTFGDMGIWSFDSMKTISTGDGGMIYLKDSHLTDKAKELLYLGVPSRQKSGLDNSSLGNKNWWEIEVNALGRRSMMNNISAAIGLAQIAKLNGFLNRRREIYEIYINQLSKISWLKLPPKLEDYIESSYYFFWIQLEKRNELARYLLKNDVYTTFRYWPLNKIKYFNKYHEKFKNSEFASSSTLNLPIHQSLTNENISKIIDLLKSFGKKYY